MSAKEYRRLAAEIKATYPYGHAVTEDKEGNEVHLKSRQVAWLLEQMADIVDTMKAR